MEIKFKSKDLENLYYYERGKAKYSQAVVNAFFEVVSTLEAVQSEVDLYNLKSLHFEKLSGDRGSRNERSVRLNKQWRLIVRIEEDEDGKFILIIEIVDYH